MKKKHQMSINFWSRKVLENPFYKQNVSEENIQLCEAESLHV